MSSSTAGGSWCSWPPAPSQHCRLTPVYLQHISARSRSWLCSTTQDCSWATATVMLCQVHSWRLHNESSEGTVPARCLSRAGPAVRGLSAHAATVRHERISRVIRRLSSSGVYMHAQGRTWSGTPARWRPWTQALSSTAEACWPRKLPAPLPACLTPPPTQDALQGGGPGVWGRPAPRGSGGLRAAAASRQLLPAGCPGAPGCTPRARSGGVCHHHCCCGTCFSRSWRPGQASFRQAEYKTRRASMGSGGPSRVQGLPPGLLVPLQHSAPAVQLVQLEEEAGSTPGAARAAGPTCPPCAGTASCYSPTAGPLCPLCPQLAAAASACRHGRRE